MAGFQQAANAITSAYGTVAGRVGIYNELVGKNKEQKEQLEKQNKELKDAYIALQEMSTDAQVALDAIHQKEFEKEMERQERRERKKEQKKMEEEHQKMIDRRASIIDREWERKASHMSKNTMLNALYSDFFASGSGGGI